MGFGKGALLWLIGIPLPIIILATSWTTECEMSLTQKLQPDRSKINMQDADELHFWVKHLQVSAEDLRKA
ncbi:DUF3606 domain-containing protein [Bradyrhizobium sp. ORS 111]|uniref:DUF3606 domain-containing protein n=1 Tax=Bradyrhizobium sp. ORS 111 TaxID=1685958 RepID=UPI00388E4EFB